MDQYVPIFTDHLLFAKLRIKFLTCISSFNFHNSLHSHESYYPYYVIGELVVELAVLTFTGHSAGKPHLCPSQKFPNSFCSQCTQCFDNFCFIEHTG